MNRKTLKDTFTVFGVIAFVSCIIALIIFAAQ